MFLPQVYENNPYQSTFPKCQQCSRLFSNTEKLKAHTCSALKVVNNQKDNSKKDILKRSHSSVNNGGVSSKRSRTTEDRWESAIKHLEAKYRPPKLETEEEINAWIAERRKRFPTAEKIEQSKSVITPVQDDKKETPKKICQQFKKYNRCKFGQKCRNLHVTCSGDDEESQSPCLLKKSSGRKKNCNQPKSILDAVINSLDLGDLPELEENSSLKLDSIRFIMSSNDQ